MAKSCSAMSFTAGRLRCYWAILVLAVHLSYELIKNWWQSLKLFLGSSWQVQAYKLFKTNSFLSYQGTGLVISFLLTGWRICQKRLQRLLCSALGDLNLGHIPGTTQQYWDCSLPLSASLFSCLTPDSTVSHRQNLKPTPNLSLWSIKWGNTE